jgi:DNA-binding beta-propeller fold protein YncE
MRRGPFSVRVKWSVVLGVVLIVGGAGASAMGRGAPAHNSQHGSVALGGSPGNPVANPQTHTLYVPLQCRNPSNCSATAQRVLDVIDISRCNLKVVSGCRVIGTAPAGKNPIAAVIDEKSDTIYVADGSGAVTVVDGGRCNAIVRTHCRRALATIKTGGADVADALDPRTHTLYVADPSGEVFVIDVARCNSQTTTGCHQHVRRVKDPRGPDGVDVDLATDTVYVADGGTNQGPGNTVSVIKGAGCNGSTGRGCGRAPRTITVGSAPYWVTVDQATNTVYVANNNDNTVSVINGAACNASVTSGCHRTPRAVDTGGGVSFLVVDQSRHTVFALNSTDDTMSEINTRTCNGHTHSGCPARARNERATFNPPSGYNPGIFALVPSTGTAYLVNPGGEYFLAAISIKRCNAVTTAGCRTEAPTRLLNLAFPETDHATNTIYAANASKPGIEVLNGATCNLHDLSGCKSLATIPFADPQANLGAIDQATHTLYAADPFGDTVSAIDIQHCNARDTSGCSSTPPKMRVGPDAGFPVLDPATHTLYTPGATTKASMNSNTIYVDNATTCNAQVTSGCSQTATPITVGTNTAVVGLSTKTDTIYAPALGSNFLADRLWIVNVKTCNATDHTGCASAVVAKAKVGLGPNFAVVDDATNTVYVDNDADGDHPGTVSVIDSNKCNGSATGGCSKPAATVVVGRSPTGMAFDAATDTVYVADYSAAEVSIIDGSRCNADHIGGCGKSVSELATGSQPEFPFVNQKDGTAYATVHATGTAGEWSIFPASP